MNNFRIHLYPSITMFLLVASLITTSCSERDPMSLEVARARIEPLVFDDDYGDDVYYQGFSGTFFDAVSLDSVYAINGLKSLKVTVPPDGSPLGAYAGGVLTSAGKRDLADFNALTFYARSSVNITLNEAGFGNDNTGTSLYTAGRSNLSLTPDWTFVVIPIPEAAKLIAERGMFTFAERWEPPYRDGYEVWFDEIRFAKLSNIADPFPVMPSVLKQYFIGATASLAGTYTRFSVDGTFTIVNHSPNYFDFVSSDPSVAIVDNGEIKIVGVGDAVIRATLGDLAVAGAASMTGHEPPAKPANPPTLPAANVISMFSDVYSNVPVDSWNPGWGGSTAEVADYVVDGDNTKMYSSLNFVGIDFASRKIDASAMTHFHIDVYAPAGTNFRVKVVAISGVSGEAPVESELTFDATTTPAFSSGEWSYLEIPLEDFQLDAVWDAWANIAQIVLSTADARLVLVDNLYWHN